MKYIKSEFSLKARVQSPGWTKGVGQTPKVIFSEYGYVAIKSNGMTNEACINMTHTICIVDD